jgi:hypothetical protein
MNEVLNNLGDFLSNNLPRILTAIGVLIIGFLVALIIAKIVRALLRKTNLDNRLATLVAGDSNSYSPQVENFISQIIFYLLLLAAFVAFFTTLGVPQVTEPVRGFVNRVFDFLPNIVGAVVLTIIAFFLANVAKVVSKRAMEAINFEDKVKDKTAVVSEKFQEGVEGDDKIKDAAQATAEKVQSVSVTDSISSVLYYLVLILFLPAILGALNLEGLLSPVQGLVNGFLSYIPNLAGAALILVVGYFGARILKGIATNFFRAVGLDTLGQRVGLTNIMGGQSLSSLAGLIVYILILLPVIVSALNALQIEAVTRPASNLINQVLSVLPALFAAALLLVLAYIVGKVVSEILSSLLTNLGFDSILQKIGLTRAHQQVQSSQTTPSKAVGSIALAYIMVFATIEAFGLLQFNILANLLTRFVALTGNVIIGLVVFGVGLFLANFVANLIKDSNLNSSNILAPVARIAIAVLAGAMGLGQMGLASDIVNLAFGLTLGSLAVAFALAFGLGGREAAAEISRDLLNSFRSKSGGK